MKRQALKQTRSALAATTRRALQAEERVRELEGEVQQLGAARSAALLRVQIAESALDTLDEALEETPPKVSPATCGKAKLIHAVPWTPGSKAGAAACGFRPPYKSKGWQASEGPVDCPACLRRGEPQGQ